MNRNIRGDEYVDVGRVLEGGQDVDLDDESRDAFRRLRHQIRAATALRRTLISLDDEVSPQQAHRSQATENAWRQMERTFGLLTSREVAERVGSAAKSGGSYASDARRHGRLMGVQRLNRLLYPAFQFGPKGPLEVIRDLRSAAEELDVTEESALLWMTAPTTWWGDGSRPVDHLDQPEEVTRAFRDHYGTEW